MHLSKAFDTLPHGLIALKLKQCQVDDKIINLIKDYLFNRRQRVKLGNVILHGRIQRLEFPKYPYLALFYSTYLWKILFTWQNVETYTYQSTYADDTPIFFTDTDPLIVQETINSDLSNVDKRFFGKLREKKPL